MHSQLIVAERWQKPSTSDLERRNEGSVLSETDRTGFVSNKKANGNHKKALWCEVFCHDIVLDHYPGPSLPVWPRHKEYLKLVIVMHRLCLNNSIALAAIDRERSTI